MRYWKILFVGGAMKLLIVTLMRLLSVVKRQVSSIRINLPYNLVCMENNTIAGTFLSSSVDLFQRKCKWGEGYCKN